jgi:hypothetical protein
MEEFKMTLYKKSLIGLGLVTLVGVVSGPTIIEELTLRRGAKGYEPNKSGFKLSKFTEDATYTIIARNVDKPSECELDVIKTGDTFQVGAIYDCEGNPKEFSTHNTLERPAINTSYCNLSKGKKCDYIKERCDKFLAEVRLKTGYEFGLELWKKGRN